MGVVLVAMLVGCGGSSGGGGGAIDSPQTPLTYNISGQVSGVTGTTTITATGTSSTKTSVTDANGSYSISGLANGSYTVQPGRAGYVFTPLNQSVTVSGSNVSSINFTGAATASYTISGTVSGDVKQGVTITLSGTNTATATTDANGNYSFVGIANGSYTLTASLAGYTFSSAITATVNNADSTGNNFTATAVPLTYTISGAVSGPFKQGVTINLTGGASASTTTDVNGNYSFAGLVSGSYVVTPVLAGHTYSPASRTVSLVNANSTGNDFTDTTTYYSISGTVTGSVQQGVTITLSGTAGSTTTTDGTGNYTFTGLLNGSYTVAPSRTGYVFSPASLAVTINNANSTGRNFTSSPVPTYLLSGTISMSGGGALAGVTVTLGGANSGTATTDGGGNYSFNVADGFYTVTPTLAGWNFSPANIARTLSGAASTANNFTASSAVAGYTVSGTIAYSGSQTGKIYVGLMWSGGGTQGQGTVLASAGTYTIRGVQNGSYKVTAFMDIGNGMPNVGNPSGQSGTINVSNGNTTANITVTDPVVTPSIPQNPGAFPMNNGVGIGWDTIMGSCSSSRCFGATGYNIYSSTSLSGTYTLMATAPGGDSGLYYKTGLTNGDTYYYKMTSLIGSAESALSSAIGPVTVGVPAGGVDVSGTVTFNGSGTGHNLFVIVYKIGGNGAYATLIVNPTSPQIYTVSGVQPGTYGIFAFVDADDNGAPTQNDIYPNWNIEPLITVGGSNYTGANLTFNNVVASGAQAKVRTAHFYNVSWVPADQYQMIQSISNGLKMPVKATVISGPNIPVPHDLVNMNLDMIQTWTWLGALVPKVGDTYVYDVIYGDGTTETLTASVTGIVPNNAMSAPSSPANGAIGVSTKPTFTWTAPSSPLPSFTYRIELNLASNNNWIWNYPDGQFSGMPSSQTSVLYNVDSRANLPALNGNTQYLWWMIVQDSNGNQGRQTATFTTAAVASTITITGTMVDVKTGTPIANAEVDVFTISTTPTYSTLTDGSGNYAVTAPANQEFVLGFAPAGYAPKLTNYIVRANNSAINLNAVDLATALANIKATGQCASASAFSDPCIQGKAWLAINPTKTAGGDAPGITASSSPAGLVFAYNDGTGVFSGSATVVRTSNTWIPMIYSNSSSEGRFAVTLTDGVTTKTPSYYLKFGVITANSPGGF